MQHSRSGTLDKAAFATATVSATKVVVELGMGDGRLLEGLVKQLPSTENQKVLYIGIEKDRYQYSTAKSRFGLANAWLINASFEDIIPLFPDQSVDRFLAILPDPAYIDRKSTGWENLYKALHVKLKNRGSLQIVTEITNDLFGPIEDSEYNDWVAWLGTAFESMGFRIASRINGSPPEYSSRCLDQFRGDEERIRMVTLDLEKDSR